MPKKKVSLGLGTALFIAKRLIDFYTGGGEKKSMTKCCCYFAWMLVLGKSFSWLMSVFVSTLDIHETVIYICTVFIFYSQIITQNNWNIHALYSRNLWHIHLWFSISIDYLHRYTILACTINLCMVYMVHLLHSFVYSITANSTTHTHTHTLKYKT